MEPIEAKMDLFQSLKDEDDELEGYKMEQKTSLSESETAEDNKIESRRDSRTDNDDDNDNVAGSSSSGTKKKVDKQNRKEIEEEEREKML